MKIPIKKSFDHALQLSLFGSAPQADAPKESPKEETKAAGKTLPFTAKVSWQVFLDGASRGNPGAAGAGMYCVDSDKNVIFKKGIYLGEKTNNQAEYLALACALYFIQKELEKRELKNLAIVFTSDSELLIKQMQGLYKVKNPHLKHIKERIETHLHSFSYSFKHVLREYNVQADALANLGIDKKAKIPEPLATFLKTFQLPL